MEPAEDLQSKKRVISGADLLRRGATLLREPCPRCGGLQLRYMGKSYCINEDDIDSVLNPPVEAPPKEAASSNMPTLKKLVQEKLDSVSKQLESTTDVDEQSRLLDLISKYVETLEKLKKSES